MSSGSYKLDELRARVADLRGPGIVSARAYLKESRKLRAATALAQALSVLHWSMNRAAAHLGVNESVLRSWLEAHSQPAWIPLALPRDGYLAYLEALLGDVPPESVRDGTNG